MQNLIRVHHISFKNALEGLIHTAKTQPNFRFHLAALVLVCLTGAWLKIQNYEWLILLFTFNTVLVAEMINTAIESMVDLITTERRESARIAKDVSAGMVLVSSCFAVIIGLYIFLPKILQLI